MTNKVSELQRLPVPSIVNWERLYQPNARVRCIKDTPPRRHVGIGRELHPGDIVAVDSVCWSGRYEIGVKEECSFYELEGYFEVMI